MHNFFGHAHATMADCFWSGVYFHGEAESLVSKRTRHLPENQWAAPDLVACRDPLQAHNLGPDEGGPARRVLSTVKCRVATSVLGEDCVLYGELARLFLWFAGERPQGLIVLATDEEALKYAQAQRRSRPATL